MAFTEQEPALLLEARDEAAALLAENGGRQRTISLEEALIMQAASHILSERDNFHGAEVVDLMGIEPGAVWPTLIRFERRYRLTTSGHEDIHEAAEQGRRPRHFYIPTELGDQVFGLFVPETTI